MGSKKFYQPIDNGFHCQKVDHLLLKEKYELSRFTECLQKDKIALRIFPDAVLRERAQPVCTFDHALQAFSDRMFAFMKRNKGIGLAAPQVGVLYQILVADIQGVDHCLVNPEILVLSKEADCETEGCLSLPERWFTVTRPMQIEVQGRSPKGEKRQFEASGLSARVLLHEIDHLNGVLICDKGSEIKS